MDIKTQQEIDFYESEQYDKKRKEEFYKMAFTIPEQDLTPKESSKPEDPPLSKEQLRKARLQFYEKNK